MSNSLEAERAELTASKLYGTGMVPLAATETTILSAQATYLRATLTVSSLDASTSRDCTIYLKPTAGTSAADGNTKVKAFPIAAFGILTLTFNVPPGYVITGLGSSANKLNAEVSAEVER